MKDINEIKKQFDEHKINSAEIEYQDKVEIAKMYEKEIEQMREEIADIKKRIKEYKNKIKNLDE
ncbi:MAG: hypothetical protein J6A15_04610 [Clostridia bacterium]|nr:hypothetical protein [Clostridia bacterium]